MKPTFLIALAVLGANLGTAAAVLGDGASATAPNMDAANLEALRTSLARVDDGGTQARAAADRALEAGRPDLLVSGITNRLYDVRIYSLELLSRAPFTDRVLVLVAALATPAPWQPEAKLGELIVSQERFLRATTAIIQGILNQPPPESALLDAEKRNRLVSDLRAALSARLQADALKWDDGGTAASAACDLAVKLQEATVLVSGVSNRLYDIKRHAVQCLPKLDRAQQVNALNRILRDEALWTKEQKIGELIVSQERFVSEVQALLASLLKQDLQSADLFSAGARASLAAQLAAK